MMNDCTENGGNAWMKTANIPTVKLGVVAVSRDCFDCPLHRPENRVCGELAQSGGCL